ncbi:MAG: GntR family transcriptional regulator [Phycisphaeraceae bacterium]|nr:GntR family transcriptional regulator [Phycisphaeraceae bacterium]
MNPRVTRNKTAPKQNQILSDLRQAIVTGQYKPGDRMPNRHEVASRYDVSSFTVQQAMDTLATQGFIEPHGSRGTFVRPYPPHLCHYALVLPFLPDDESARWSRYYTALATEAHAMQEEVDRHRPGTMRMTVYQGVDGHSDSEDYLALLQRIETQTLAGVILKVSPPLIDHTPIMTDPRLPRVAIMDRHYVPDLPTVGASPFTLIDRGIEHLASRGRKQLAVLTCSPDPDGIRRHVANRAAMMGMKLSPYAVQHVDPRCPAWARHTVHLMLNAQQVDRPDALLIDDDHLVEHGTAGVATAGLRAPDAIDVVAAANFPYLPLNHVPVTWIGWSVRQTLQASLAVIDEQRRGRQPVQMTEVPTLFGHEFGLGGQVGNPPVTAVSPLSVVPVSSTISG